MFRKTSNQNSIVYQALMPLIKEAQSEADVVGAEPPQSGPPANTPPAPTGEAPIHLNGTPDRSIVAKQVKAKKIAPALATVATEDCVMDTLETHAEHPEGVKVPKGNLILSGVKGELWSPGPVSIFSTKYDKVDVSPAIIGNLKKKNPNALASPSPQTGLISGKVEEIGYVMKKGDYLDCFQINVPFTVKVSWQAELLKGNPTDWFVVYGPNDFGAVADDIFRSSYKIA